jgi:amidase
LVNAVATTCFDRARKHAELLMEKPISERGMLAGLPVLIKDLSMVEGVRSTYGSAIFKDRIPVQSDHVVKALESSGGVISGKSNTPEFGAGGNTFNDVFGATLNPWDTNLSAAGSSGGSAVALATGMAWLAHGSDLGGSLRNPASFNGVIGLRPSPFLVPSGPAPDTFNGLGVEGPMARRVEDLALMLDAMVTNAPNPSFLDAAKTCTKPMRVAFSEDLGITPVDPEIARICRAAAEQLAKSGVDVIEAHPDLSEAHEAFQTLRAHGFAESLRSLYDKRYEELKPELAWNIKRGLALTQTQITKAEGQREELQKKAGDFMAGVDLLLTPATIVPPYPAQNRYPASCNGVEFETYVDWLAIAYSISLTALPALSLPCGMTASKLPVGLQVIGKPRGEAMLLSHANFMQNVLGLMPTPVTPQLHN